MKTRAEIQAVIDLFADFLDEASPVIGADEEARVVSIVLALSWAGDIVVPQLREADFETLLTLTRKFLASIEQARARAKRHASN